MKSKHARRLLFITAMIVIPINILESQETLNDGLVGLWTFEDPHVLERDESGYKQDAVNNYVEVTTGIVGDHAARFNGTTSNITIYNTVKWDPELNPTKSVSASAWFRTKQKAENYTSIIRHEKHFTPFQLTPNGTAWVATFHPDLNVNLQYDWDGEYNDSTWHHIVVQFYEHTGSGIETIGVTEVWMDTVIIKQMTNDIPYLVPDSTKNYPWMFGMNESGQEPYHGELDQVRLYNRLLSSVEIRRLYHEPTNSIDLPASIDNRMVELPTRLKLGQNYPNPFNGSTKIDFLLNHDTELILSIHNVEGKLVKILEDGPRSAGIYSTIWNGTNLYNRPVPSGIYIYTMSTEGINYSKRLLLIK